MKSDQKVDFLQSDQSQDGSSRSLDMSRPRRRATALHRLVPLLLLALIVPVLVRQLAAKQAASLDNVAQKEALARLCWLGRLLDSFVNDDQLRVE